MATVPIQGIFHGDFVAVLVVVDTDDTITTVGEKIAYHSVDRRVPAQDAPIKVRRDGQILTGDSTVGEIGLDPLDVIEAGYV